MQPATIRDVATKADADRFVGRTFELDAARDLLDAKTPSRVLYLHGPGGIGKSAVIRMIEPIAEQAGFTPVPLATALGSRAFEAQLEQIRTRRAEPLLVIVDEVDRLGSELGTWRDRLLDTLASTDRVIFSGRNPPDPSWRHDSLYAIVTDIELFPLDPSDAERLLERHGVDGPQRDQIINWSQGSPLALTIAALSPTTPVKQPLTTALEARLTTWLTGKPSLDVATEVLEVAALAPIVDARILAAALPARSTRDAMARLFDLPVVDRVGDRAILHRVLAEAVRQRLASEAPERHRSLSRRIVEHLGARARLGDIAALIELSQFITDPLLRQTIANTPSATLFTDTPRDDELATFLREQGFLANPDLDELREWDERCARFRLVVRRVDGSIVLYGSFARADAIDAFGPVSSSLRQSTVASGTDPTRSFVGVVYFADADEAIRNDAARLGAGALMHLHGIPDMQSVLIHYPQPDRRPAEVLTAIARPFEVASARPIAITDFRPLGVVGFVEGVVLADLGYRPRSSEYEDLLATDSDPQRIERLRVRMDEVFGPAAHDQRLRRVIELVHIEPRRPQQECQELLHVSRRTWFRLLRQARERVLEVTSD